ncbi:unnamed protein product [Cuscuta campestris]|uniref:DUF4408 domain-containing protein n=1 Tax=Cuscuta campestris TaxID=132261 RepID=A0A484KX05_9ASTE|nr:unnamed protein product [Cuscuta campestris]
MIPDNLKTKKKKKNHKLHKMHLIAAVAFRLVELCMFLTVFWRFSGHLSAGVAKLSGGYFIKTLSGTLISPRFVFLVGNAIFLVLVRRSGQEKQGSGENLDLYEEHLKQSGKNQEFWHGEQGTKKKKQGNCKMQRSRSEEGRKRGGGYEELRRSATVSRRKREAGAPAAAAATEEMSSEEFRRKVEDFIAKQRMALMEEECSYMHS